MSLWLVIFVCLIGVKNDRLLSSTYWNWVDVLSMLNVPTTIFVLISFLTMFKYFQAELMEMQKDQVTNLNHYMYVSNAFLFSFLKIFNILDHSSTCRFIIWCCFELSDLIYFVFWISADYADLYFLRCETYQLFLRKLVSSCFSLQCIITMTLYFFSEIPLNFSRARI